MRKNYVLDANAVFDYLQQGPGAGTLDRLFHEAFRQEATVIISVVTLGEVFYLLWRNKGEGKAHETISNFRSFPLRIFDVDLALALKAGELKARQKLPYVDSIVASLALDQQATIVTSDRDFEKLGRRISVLWLPRP